MTIETYYNFLKIVECGNILAASNELLIAQPALSTQLKNLEGTLGVQLLERGSKKLTLTPAGEIFYKKAFVICSLNDSMKDELNNYISGTEGLLKFSLTPTNTPQMMHLLFDNFTKTHPKVMYEIHEVLSDQVAENVRTGISELGLIRSKVRNMDDFDVIPFQTEEFVAIVNEKSPLAKYDSLSLRQLKHVPIATTHVIAPKITTAFETIGTKPNFYLTTATRRTAVFWTQNYNTCISILPCSPDERDTPDEGCKLLPISDYDFSYQRCFITMKGRRLSPIVNDFLKSLNINYSQYL